ncbi:hypothetical protein BJX61DRAFT_541388 [Aspergillus egyptiacus]|nr:hypothetical protein BJX61DRAFT_541388 [Aspergillus egyptiacus]
MGVPFEALIPYGIVVAMFGVSGVGLWGAKYIANDGKKARWNQDLWDRQSILTGKFRGQSTNPEAPPFYTYANPWKLEKRIY